MSVVSVVSVPEGCEGGGFGVGGSEFRVQQSSSDLILRNKRRVWCTHALPGALTLLTLLTPLIETIRRRTMRHLISFRGEEVSRTQLRAQFTGCSSPPTPA